MAIMRTANYAMLYQRLQTSSPSPDGEGLDVRNRYFIL